MNLFFYYLITDHSETDFCSGHRISSTDVWESVWTESSSDRTWGGSWQTTRCYQVKMEQNWLQSVAQTRHQGDMQWGNKPVEKKAWWCYRDSENNGRHLTVLCRSPRCWNTANRMGNKKEKLAFDWLLARAHWGGVVYCTGDNTENWRRWLIKYCLFLFLVSFGKHHVSGEAVQTHFIIY